MPRNASKAAKTAGQIFLSYAHKDLVTVRKVYEGLTARGLDVWFDKESMTSGRWRPQITKAIARSRYFFICISRAALKNIGDDPGFQDDELNTAYDIAQQQDEKVFTIVPVRLEDCGRGDSRLSVFHQYDLFPKSKFQEELNRLAVAHGGRSLADPGARDKRTDRDRRRDALWGKAEVALYAHDYPKAVNTLRDIGRKYPSAKKAALLETARAHRLSGDTARAREILDDLIAKVPDYAPARYERAQLRFDTKDYHAAALDLQYGFGADQTYGRHCRFGAYNQLGRRLLDKVGPSEQESLRKFMRPDFSPGRRGSGRSGRGGGFGGAF